MQARGQTALFGGSMVCNCGFHAVKVMYKKHTSDYLASHVSYNAVAVTLHDILLF